MSVQKLLTRLPVGQSVMRGQLLIPPHAELPAPAVVIYHGRGSSQCKWLQRAEVIANRGIVCLTFDFRGCGTSDGDIHTLTLADGLQDALEAVDFLTHRSDVDRQRLGILGCSFGGYLASIVSSMRKVKSMVLRVPAVYRDEWFDKPYPYIEQNRNVVSCFRADGPINEIRGLKAISQFEGPLLIVAAGNDSVVPARVTDIYYSLAHRTTKKKLVTIPDAGHTFDIPELDQTATTLAADWFTDTL